MLSIGVILSGEAKLLPFAIEPTIVMTQSSGLVDSIFDVLSYMGSSDYPR